MFKDYKIKSGRTFMLSSRQYDHLEEGGKLDELKDSFFAEETLGRLKNVKRRFRAYVFCVAAAVSALGVGFGQGISADFATKGKTNIFFDSIKTEQNTNENLDNEFRNTLRKMKFLGIRERDIEPLLLALPTQEQRIAYLDNLANKSRLASRTALGSYVALYVIARKCLRKYYQRQSELNEIKFDWAMEDIPNSIVKSEFCLDKRSILNNGKAKWCRQNGVDPMHKKFDIDFQIVDEEIRPIAVQILSEELGLKIESDDDYATFCEMYADKIQKIIDITMNIMVEKQLNGKDEPLIIEIDREMMR